MEMLRRRFHGGHQHEYALLGGNEKARPRLWTRKHSILVLLLIALATLFFVSLSIRSGEQPCDTPEAGYQCRPEISHFWGQYSPYFSVASDIPAHTPEGCHITFAQVLARHGARDPTLGKSLLYGATIERLKANVKHFPGRYAFLADYEYTLGADQLSIFGQRQLVSAGVNFYERYKPLSRDFVPFLRASGQKRVIDSAWNWTQGFREAMLADEHTNPHHPSLPAVDVVVSEEEGMNNTLHHDICTEFETGKFGAIGSTAKFKWVEVFAEPIRARFNADLIGANLTLTEVIYLMELCPFETVASPTGKISRICDLFTTEEWRQYNYYGSLDKWYGYGHGNPLGPTQGVGFVNELIARMTDEAVTDTTSTNRTLDSDPQTFPLGRRLYADFSHDNDMTAIMAALGLYGETSHLPNRTLVGAPEAGGFSAAWTVPFAGRVYFEKLQCAGHDEELVRVLVNDRVQPLLQCEGDALGRCTLSAFVDSLQFARSGGHWAACFK
ncbi:histidine phosphatase superfamily [Neohortaea acidophila]|uniref:Phytase A n=1 Tax=Neohortaea acidophila TaxID=245834 RepID=A0A6A6PW81_9PEZI|nr:histidine phosphatase superfamily [Neohortaea acidophila]KAF2483929.1 histidine phosphatase superfamily [Neohortaea acidophila]